ncbi:MAG: glyoxylate/hydroxypyruvate reductase A [Rhodospirillales bacterium]
MSLLIHINTDSWMPDKDLHAILQPMMPETIIHLGRPDRVLEDVTMMATTDFDKDVMTFLPNLQLVQKLGAGVEAMVNDPHLPDHVRVTRLASHNQAVEMAQYCLAYILHGQRNMAYHREQQLAGVWHEIPSLRNEKTTVAVLGLGTIGSMIASMLLSFDFRVVGWSRSAKTIEGVECRAGAESLPAVLSKADYVVAILPSTPETTDLFDGAMLQRMKPGSTLINIGRGTLIAEADLIAALDAGTPGRAILDVFREEPLPAGHPFWTHPAITVTPHVSGWNIDDGFPDVAENYRRLMAGEPLLHEIDRTAGY